MIVHLLYWRSGLFSTSRQWLRSLYPAGQAGLTLAVTVLALLAGREVSAQAVPGPYSNYNWNYSGSPNYNWGYGGPLYYNPTYARYGLPGVGVSPWDPIVQAQLNLGMRTARYQMYDAWANQSNAAANLYNQQAIAQAMQNARQQQQQPVPPRYDVRQRVPRPVPTAEQEAPRLLPRHEVLKDDGEVIWPASAPSDGSFGRLRAAAEGAIRVAVKEARADGKASIQSIAEAKSLLFEYGKPALVQVDQASRAQARRLLTFFTSLEKALNGLAGQ